MKRLAVLPLCLVLLLLVGAAGPLQATAQQPETIRLGDKVYHLLTNPLGPFLERHPDSLPTSPTDDGVETISTGLWRGYRASWRVSDGALYLEGVEILAVVEESEEYSTEFRDVTDEMFDNATPLLADWFSGYLIIPTGKRVHYVHMDYASLYRRYRVLRVESGIVVAEERYRQRGFVAFRDAQFERFKRTERYRVLMEHYGAGEEFAREVAQGEYTSTIYDE